MQNMRKHKRFKLDVVDLKIRMSLVGEVEIIDISPGGVAVKADRQLNIGKECLMTLTYKGTHINLKGVVVRSELSRMEDRADGEKVTIYSAGILFKDESAGKVSDFLDSIENSRKMQVPEQAGWYYRDIHFYITTPSEEVLQLSAQFGVKEISQSGIIIQTGQKLNIDSMVLLELTLSSSDPVSFMGKIVSCRSTQDTEPARYDIGVEFTELTERDRLSLEKLIECVKNNEKDSEGC
jgi:Tfp pilus assembly protein PilZ